MTELVWRCTRADNYKQVFISEVDASEEFATVRDCTCSSFDYNGSCEHVAFMQMTLCTWSSDAAHAAPVGVGPPPHCPKCFGPVAVYDADEGL